MSQRRSRRGWLHQRQMMAVDAVAAALATLTINLAHESGLALVLQRSITFNVLSVLMPLVWVLILELHRAYDRSAITAVRTARTAVRTARMRVVQAGLTGC
jgi:hypothetical protein